MSIHKKGREVRGSKLQAVVVAQGSNKLERQRKLEAHKKEEKAEVENGFLERDEHKTLWQTCMDGADT